MATRYISAEQVAALMMKTDQESVNPDMDISDSDLHSDWNSEKRGDMMISLHSYVSSNDGFQHAACSRPRLCVVRTGEAHGR